VTEQVEIEGLRISYERAGAGPPVVLVHGFVGDGQATWSRQLADLSDEFTVLAWDAPGAGGSSDPPEWFRISDYADCLATFVRAVGFPEAHLVGLSFGGALALATYERHRSLPCSLVLVGAYAGWAGSLPPEEVDERLRLSLRLAELPPEELADALLPSMFSANAPAAAVAEFIASLRAVRPAGFLAMARSSAEADLRPMLSDVDVPTLLLSGDQDVRAPLAVAEAIHTGVAGSRLVVMPGVGHVSSVEAPELVTREIRGFLRRFDG
jgi:pimeloyl-ACP methyl ester carboxylesterase